MDPDGSLRDPHTKIEWFAFEGATRLTNIRIPANISTIGDGAFRSCFNLRGVFFRGDAPTAAWIVFDGTDATIYYSLGATGWGTTFAERPTKRWNPVIQLDDASFGVRFNLFGFYITGTMDIPIVVEACTSLANPDWTPLQSCTLTNGSLDFRDPHSKNYPSRFYRIRWP